MAERHVCPACGQNFGSKREADEHAMKAHGAMDGKKGGEEQPDLKKEATERPS